MLDLKYIRTHSQEVIENCKHRLVDVDVPHLLGIDQQVRDSKGKLDSLRQERNAVSDQIKVCKSQEQRTTLVARAKFLRDEEAALESSYQRLESERRALQVRIPNQTHPETPIGATEDESRVLREVGQIPSFSFQPKDHVELMESLNLVDFDGGAKVSGNKFYYLKNEAVLLEMALIQYALNLLKKEGFQLFITPDLARKDILDGLGFNPRGTASQIYSIENTDLCLIATAEITLGGLLSSTILEEKSLPILYAGVSHCFRTEAGSAGKESKGLYRVHQFTKVEMFAFVHPDEAETMHQRILAIEEKIYQDLGIPYRVLDICTGDLGGPAYRKYDLEAWMPGRNKWGEVTSTSNCTDYQARRLNVRYREKESGGIQYVYMLNGTAIATSRTIIALLENGQQEDGSILLPKCLGLPPILCP